MDASATVLQHTSGACLFNICLIVTDDWVHLTARRQGPTGFLCGISTNAPECPAFPREAVRIVGEGCFQVPLSNLCSSTLCWNGQAEQLLPAQRRLRCTHYGDG